MSLSHVSYSTGEVLPISEIVVEAHERGVLVVVDGAQSFGALPVDVVALGADFYSAPGQKWLCGPEGTGALYSSQAAVSQIRTTFASYGTVDAYNDYGGFLVRPDGVNGHQKVPVGGHGGCPARGHGSVPRA
ncbi:MAG: aminotransferase class V-fold PLP-dependent enzyme, partial [Acidimicrobiales bacterium]